MVTGLIVLYFWKKGVSFAAVSAFFDWPILRMIPIIGWEISAFHLILLSPDLLNAAGMVLYLLTTILLVILEMCIRDSHLLHSLPHRWEKEA